MTRIINCLFLSFSMLVWTSVGASHQMNKSNEDVHSGLLHDNVRGTQNLVPLKDGHYPTSAHQTQVPSVHNKTSSSSKSVHDRRSSPSKKVSSSVAHESFSHRAFGAEQSSSFYSDPLGDSPNIPAAAPVPEELPPLNLEDFGSQQFFEPVPDPANQPFFDNQFPSPPPQTSSTPFDIPPPPETFTVPQYGDLPLPPPPPQPTEPFYSSPPEPTQFDSPQDDSFYSVAPVLRPQPNYPQNDPVFADEPSPPPRVNYPQDDPFYSAVPEKEPLVPFPSFPAEPVSAPESSYLNDERVNSLNGAKQRNYDTLYTSTSVNIPTYQSRPEQDKRPQEWVIPKGRTLKFTLDSWCQLAGWTLVWDTPKQQVMAASGTIFGTFDEAINVIFTSLRQANSPFVAEKYLANNVLRVRSR